MKSIFILSLILISQSSFAEKCSVEVNKVVAIAQFSSQKIPARHFSKPELVTMFAVRDRILETGSAILTKTEADLFSEINVTLIKEGSQISMSTFESLLLKGFEKLLYSFALRPEFRSNNLEDTLQAARVGFLDAIRRYDPEMAMLSTYAFEYIRKEINTMIIHDEAVIRYGNSQQMVQARRIAELYNILKNKLQKAPNVQELADAYQAKYPDIKPLTKGMIERLLERLAVQRGEALNADGTEIDFPSQHGNPESALREKQASLEIQNLMRKADLTSRQRRVLILRYGLQMPVLDNQGQPVRVPEEGMNTREISEIDGTTHQNVVMMLDKAMKALQQAATH